jgi:peptidoglycan/LPS O-acetylase OafA/YrhL
LRIIPLFWFTLAVKASVETIAGKHDRLPSNAAEAAAYLAQNAFLIFPFIGVRAYITVSWTLSYICLGYLIIPALIQLCRKRGWNGGARMILAWLLLLFFVFVPMATPRIGWNGAGLALGMMVYELNQSRRLIRRVGWLDLFTLFAFAAGCGFFNLLSLLPPSGHTNAMRFVALFASLAPVMMLFTGRIAPGGWLNQALAGPLFNRFAFISYAFYLMHGLTWIVFGWIGMHRMTEGGGGFISLLLLALAVAVGIASLVHRYVEPRLEELVSFALHFLYSQTASRLQLTRFLNRPVLSRVP